MFEIKAAGTRYVRCRSKAGDAPYGPRMMGPPPKQYAIQSNRMSPAGVPMFYGAEEEATSLAETAAERGRFAVATFEINRDIVLLDLRKVPDIPSIFALDLSEKRAWAQFMRGFLEDFRKPIARDGREHVEYVPTQALTEYFRTVATFEGKAIDGILYASAKRANATAAVLFADTNAVSNPEQDSGSDACDAWESGPTWLEMVTYWEVEYDPVSGEITPTRD